jgi:glycosyltransferase involved in cell wall biosynthesis
MITGRDFVYISSIEWNFLWQTHQEIATRLAQAGNRVFYIENMGVRSPRLGDATRVVARLKRWAANRRSKGVREIVPGVYVCSPLVFPPFQRGWRRQLNRRFFLPSLKRTALRLGFRDPIIWTYLPTDTVGDLIRLFRSPRSLVIYYSVADFSQLTTSVAQLQASEKELLELSDVVFASCEQLARNAALGNDHVYLSPHGVNLEAFPLSGKESNCPQELAHLPRPIVGYVGGIHRHVDLELVRSLALLRPDFSWVFVGPLQTPVGNLEALPNLHFLGAKPHSEIAAYLRAADVCIVPYANTESTATVVPTKINEYLAMGKPVVSIDLPPVREFNLLHHVLELSSGQPDEFLRAIEQALASAKDKSQIERRRAVAAAADWSLRLETISEIISGRLP